MIELNNDLGISCLLTVLVGLFSYYTLKKYLLRQKYKHIPGPPANGIIGFYFGNSFDLFNKKRQGIELIDLFVEWAKIYGNTFKIQTLKEIIVHTCDLQATREILIEKNFPKPSLFKAFGYPYNIRTIGSGLFSDLDHERWKHRRSLFNPAFHKQVLNGFIDDFNSKGDLFLEKLRKMSDGKTSVTMLDEFNRTTLDVIGSVAFGMDLNSINDPNNKLNSLITKSITLAFNYFISTKLTFSIPFSNYYKKKEMIEISKSLRSLARDQIESRLKLLQDGSYVPNDILAITLKSLENESFDMEDIIDDFITFFIAGQETTAGTLAFMIIELAKHPLVFQKLREEIDTVIGSRTFVKQEDLSELKYTGAVIKETLRLWSVAPVLNRTNPEEFQINSFKIPKNTWIQMSSYVNARLDEFFPEPLEFKPERFLIDDNNNNASDGVKSYSYYPFSLGARNCIGQNFAQFEMKILIAKLVKNFDFELVAGQNLKPTSKITLRPVDGAKCFISQRKF